jgi:hypothetical protein
VPRLSSFYGISVWIYYDEIQHHGRPHFHARYGDEHASFDIENFSLLAGRLPRHEIRLVREWARAHQQELRENWKRAREHRPLQSIEPLP